MKYKTILIKEELHKELSDLKVHKRQSFGEIIKKLLEKKKSLTPK
jgi:predicted CopG family antitoxin